MSLPPTPPAPEPAAAQPELPPGPETGPPTVPPPPTLAQPAAGAAAAATGPGVAAGFELPNAREIVGRGFELMLASTAQLRRVSLYFGGLFVAFLGPLLVLGVMVIATAPASVRDLGGLLESMGEVGPAPLPRDTPWLTAIALLSVGLYVAVIGAVFVAAEGGIVAIVILAGRRLGRRIGLRQALIRSRQVFWPVVVAGLLVSIPVGIGQLLLRGTLDATGFPDEGSSVLALLGSTVIAAPFGYAQTGVILGDVGATEAIRRSVRLFRARPWVGLAIALFPAVFNFIELAALGEGGDVLLRIGDATGLGFDSDLLHGAVTLVLLLGAVAAVGSLLFTVGALFAAPQVVAFLGLTHYAGGLDRAASPESGAAAAAAAAASAGTAGADTVPPRASIPSSVRPVVGLSAPPRLTLADLPAPPMLAPMPVAAEPPIAGPTASPSRPLDPGARFHWVTRGMLLAIIAAILLAVAGITNLAERLVG